jgi:putative intracellular protease/amidase
MAQAALKPGRVVVLIATMAAGIFFWNSEALLPFKLLAVMGHETGHALASLVVGGSVDRVSLRPDESGECLSRVPVGFLAQTIVYSAGYVGGALISVVLLLLTYRFNARRPMLAVACGWLAAMGVFYARDGFTLAFCAGMAALFGLGAKFLPPSLVGGLNLFIASFTALYSIMDLKDDLWNGAVRAHSDAQLLANVTIVPAIIWAALWTVVSVLTIFFGARAAMTDRTVGTAALPLGQPS